MPPVLAAIGSLLGIGGAAGAGAGTAAAGAGAAGTGAALGAGGASLLGAAPASGASALAPSLSLLGGATPSTGFSLFGPATATATGLPTAAAPEAAGMGFLPQTMLALGNFGRGALGAQPFGSPTPSYSAGKFLAQLPPPKPQAPAPSGAGVLQQQIERKLEMLRQFGVL